MTPSPFIIFLFGILPIVGYLLGGAAILAGAGPLKWWIIAIGTMTWWSRGAIGMANQAAARGHTSRHQVSKVIVSHWIFMIALYAVSIVALVKY